MTAPGHTGDDEPAPSRRRSGASSRLGVAAAVAFLANAVIHAVHVVDGSERNWYQIVLTVLFAVVGVAWGASAVRELRQRRAARDEAAPTGPPADDVQGQPTAVPVTPAPGVSAPDGGPGLTDRT